jgi:ATP-dependent helicase/nuclease subunit B
MIHYISLAQSFIPALAQGLMARYPNPKDMARVLVLLPTRRGCLALRQELQGQGLTLFPRVLALADLESCPILPGFMPEEETMPALSEWRRQGLLTQLVYAFEKQKYNRTNAATATALAKELMQLIDEAATSCVDLSNLKTLVVDDYAQHWQLTLDFLTILTDAWPAILATEGVIDKAQHNRENLLKIASHWNPDYPVVLAGTTGTRPATAILAKAILSFKESYVVLPGFDPLISADLRADLPPTHPQSPLVSFIKTFDSDQELQPWVREGKMTARHLWLSQAMLPSFDFATPHEIPLSASQNVTFVTADHRQDEARTIAAIIRKELETPQATVCVITPDQNLTQRITAELKRWHLTPNTSSGIPLSKTVVGTFLLLTARLNATISAADLLAILKHPLCFKGEGRFQHLLNVRTLEVTILRHPQKKFALKDLDANVLACFEPYLLLVGEKNKQSLYVWLKTHRELFEKLAGPESLSDDEDGRVALEFFDELMQAAKDYPPIDFYDYAPLLQTLMAQKQVRHPEGIGSRVYILGTLEARLQQSDVTILAGLNEGIWPQENAGDPWLSRPMRIKLGLPDPERRIGLSAHDFCLGFSASKVYLTRSQKIDGAPALASRWWQRLEAVAQAANIPLNNPEWMSDIPLIDEPRTFQKLEMPTPRPPVELRPLQYSVSDVAQLMRDPYGLYAKRILKLRPLGALEEGLEAKDRGQLIHRALELVFEKGRPINLKSVLDCGTQVFAPFITDPIVKHFWWPRFCSIAKWFVKTWQDQQEEVSETKTEIKSFLNFSIDDKDIVITSIADRIDYLKNGSVRIIDYKTGTPPTQKDVRQGLAPQLTLEALMIQHEVEELSYWHLKGGAEGGNVVVIPKLQDRLDEAFASVMKLVEAFLREKTPYLACPHDPDIPYNDYRHLERLDEWG